MPTVIEQAELRSSHLYASAGEFDELEWRAEAAGGNWQQQQQDLCMKE
jgi:hypothetical protein